LSTLVKKYVGNWRQYKAEFSLLFLIIIYTVGVVGISTSFQDLVLPLTPVTLVLSVALLLWNQEGWQPKTVLMAALAFLTGFFIEVAGVETKVIFGVYWYGETLGPKLWDVPLAMGVNWLLLVFCIGSFVANKRWPLLLKALVSALLMVGLDVLIEPMAIRLDFWDWEGGIIPLRNYIAWFGVSFALFLAYHGLKFPTANKTAFGLFVIQILFFGILNLTV